MKPEFIHRDGMITSTDYVQWLSDLKQRYRQSQIKAVVRINQSMLEFYWSLGRDIVALKAESKWGSGVLQQLSIDLQQMFPEEKGFSYRNIRYMKQWYLFYYEQVTKWHQAGAKIDDSNCQQPVGEFWQQHVAKLEMSKWHQLGAELEMPSDFALVPWKHHVEIVSKSNSLDEALFYINQTIAGNWSRSRLEDEIKSGLYKRQGKAITNFSNTLALPEQQLAQEILKDPLDLNFLHLKKGYDEHVLEEALVTNITNFLLELGKGFSYVGRQMELQMPGGQTFFPDLIFYHIPQHRYVVVELKAVKYIPEFAGKLNFYVTAVDELMRGELDNPTVGLVICKSSDKTVVEWSLKDIQKPLGVATYQLEEVVERTVKEIENRK
ncbi:MAG: DUF1016 family protein [Paludibacteraceae bacterium]|nr:DUF1016 family protein [Paludibacteraceae bacterium]